MGYNLFMAKEEYDIVIIGAGASGLMLAANLNLNGSRGVILEGSSRAGSKLLMSGGGHCNITHGGSIKDFINAYGSGGQALRRCLYKHSNLELANWLISHGIELADENGDPVDASYGTGGMDSAGRIFPASMKARDVLDVLCNETDWNGWQTVTDAKVCLGGGIRYFAIFVKFLSAQFCSVNHLPSTSLRAHCGQ